MSEYSELTDCIMCMIKLDRNGKAAAHCTGTESEYCKNHGRQNGIADYNDLAATLRDAAKDFTIDFKPAVLAALIRIEERLAQIESKGCSCK